MSDTSTFRDSRDQRRACADRLAVVDLVVEGPRGVGKTRLCREVAASLGEPGVYLDLHDAASVAALRARLAERVSQKRRWAEAARQWLFSPDPPPDRVLVEELLRNRADPGPVWIFLDEAQDWVDALADGERADVFAWLAGLRDRFEVRLALAGSVSVRRCLARHGIVLDPRWESFDVRPLPAADARTVFQESVRTVVSDAGERLAFEATGGLPRWLERVARQVDAHDATEADVALAIDRVVRAERFEQERAHVRRRLGPVAEQVLVAAAQVGASRASVRAAVRAPRAEVDAALELLVDSHLLLDGTSCSFALPIFARALRSRG